MFEVTAAIHTHDLYHSIIKPYFNMLVSLKIDVKGNRLSAEVSIQNPSVKVDTTRRLMYDFDDHLRFQLNDATGECDIIKLDQKLNLTSTFMSLGSPENYIGLVTLPKLEKDETQFYGFRLPWEFEDIDHRIPL